MGFWWWVLVFGGIAVVGLVVVALLGLRLWRKAKVLLGELGRLSEVADTLEQALAPAGDRTTWAGWSDEDWSDEDRSDDRDGGRADQAADPLGAEPPAAGRRRRPAAAR